MLILLETSVDASFWNEVSASRYFGLVRILIVPGVSGRKVWHANLQLAGFLFNFFSSVAVLADRRSAPSRTSTMQVPHCPTPPHCHIFPHVVYKSTLSLLSIMTCLNCSPPGQDKDTDGASSVVNSIVIDGVSAALSLAAAHGARGTLWRIGRLCLHVVAGLEEQVAGRLGATKHDRVELESSIIECGDAKGRQRGDNTRGNSWKPPN